MDRLPQLIYDEISSLLQDPAFDKPALATISRPWQAVIERHTFREIRLRNTDLDRFQEIVHYGRRRYVNVINYQIILPAYGDDVRCRFERENDRRANDEVFTTAIHRLFHSLKTWDVHKDGYITLRLEDVYSSSDHPSLRHSSPSFKWSDILRLHRDWDTDCNVDLWSWRWQYSYLRLLHPSKLPAVPVVASFFIPHITRHICDRVPIDIAARLPSLRVGDWRMNDWEIRYIALRRAHRRDLVQAVTEVFPRLSVLRSLTLHMSSMFFWNPNFSVGTYPPGESTVDPLSDAIRTATAGISTLRDLTISGTIDGSIFSPSLPYDLVEPYWQNLEYLTVHFETGRPSGGHYFWDPQQAARGPNHEELLPISETEVPPGYGPNEEEDAEAAISFSLRGQRDFDPRVREVHPDDDSLVPLIEAFGRACLQMPALKRAELATVIPVPPGPNTARSGENKSPWGLWYFSPGTPPGANPLEMHPAFSEDIHHRRLFWDINGWRLDMDLQTLLRSIGSERYGKYLVERFVDTWVPR
ncbi:hypothetical protein F5B20DRAFT_549409 [Whalleya microplaca]|nr:hypothetical protein F5B20DRAFT_549409 [Whalleya microplaca]